MPSYLKTFAFIVTLGLATVVGVNLIVDPEGIVQFVRINGLNYEKPAIDKTGLRRWKSIALASGNYDTIVLGTSRSLGGIDPMSSVWGDRVVYNASLPSTNMYETYQVFEFSTRNNPISTVVLGLDLSMFATEQKGLADFQTSQFADQNIILSNLSSLISWQTLDNSWQTVIFNRNRKVGRYSERGFRRVKEGLKDSETVNHRRLFKYESNNLLSGCCPFYQIKPTSLDLFHQLIKDCRQKGIEIYLFISPIHAIRLEAYQALDLFTVLENLKRDLVGILAEDRDKNPEKESILLWDFSGYNSVTTEEIPSAKSTRQMKWYVESSHYKKELGNVILDLILNYPQKSENVPTDFGRAIDRDNIESHLASIRRDRVRYRQDRPQEIKELKKLARKAGVTY